MSTEDSIQHIQCIQLSETADDSPVTRRYLREALFREAMNAAEEAKNAAKNTVESGQAINTVARVYKILRYYLEGEPLPEHYFDEPPIDETVRYPYDYPYDWMGMIRWCRENGRDVLTITREELQMFRK